MSIEQTLSEELRDVGAAVLPPPAPDAALLVRIAERARTRTLVRSGISVVLTAAVVLAIVALGGHLKNPDAGPVPTPQPTALPTGKPPQVPYIKNDVLYVKGQALAGSWGGVVNHQASSIGYPDDVSGNPETGTMVLFHDGSELARFPHVATSLLSPNGRKAAWIERDGQDWFAVVYDLETSRELGRIAVDAHDLGHVGPENEGWESLSSVDDDGVVIWAGVLTAHAWTPGHAPVETSIPDGYDAQPGDFPDPSVVTLSPDGAWGAWSEDRTGDQPQGTSTIPDQYDVHVFAQQPGQPSTRIEFRLPRNTNAAGAEWETTGDFLVTVFDDPTGVSWHYVRCTIATRGCEVAPTP